MTKKNSHSHYLPPATLYFGRANFGLVNMGFMPAGVAAIPLDRLPAPKMAVDASFQSALSPDCTSQQGFTRHPMSAMTLAIVPACMRGKAWSEHSRHLG